MKIIRVLYINGGIMDRGGISAYMMNYYRHIDRTKVQIDFVVHGFDKGVFDEEIREMGGQIYNVPVKSKDYFGNIRALRKIFKSGKYKIVHSHMDAMNTVVLKEAKKCGIPVRIAHSHNTEHLTSNKLKYFLNEIARKNVTKYSTHMCACSKMAGMWLFGNEAVENGNVKIIKNAIEVDKYRFDINARNRLRKELKLENNFIIGHVGRFDYQKNHMFILDVFAEIVKHRSDTRLLLVGDGNLRNKIETKIEKLGLQNSVILLGQRADVNELMSMFDVFILPSLFEGLGIVAVEAQANGLTCYLSSGIPREVNVTNKIQFLEIDNIEEWIKALVNIQRSDRTICKTQFLKDGYEIGSAAEELCDMYINLV